MADHEAPGGSEPYEMRSERLRGLPLIEVEERLSALEVEFGGVVASYAGPLSKFRRTLRPNDLAALNEAIGDLLPLGLNGEVQRQILASDPQADTSGLAFSRITTLSHDVMLFMAKFENTGVTVYYGDPLEL
ncbi:MAG TPA: hypothetical protein VMB52_06965 [Verrucomicrobiae bacterium]|nr:hypothetical protein [Verrucomicrobiae bacterium]